MNDKIVYSSNLFQVIERARCNELEVDGRQIKKDIVYELVRRPPGVRAIIFDKSKILLNQEYRFELDDWDYRLPGGKVFDDAVSYQNALENNMLKEAIISQLKNEVKEEADIEIISYDFLKKSTCGFTVEWDLYFFTIENFRLLPNFSSQNLQKSEYEFISHKWVPFKEALQLCIDGKISEDRSASILMRFLLSKILI